MIADSANAVYRAYPSLDQARADPNAAVVLEGDDGGQIYAVFPAGRVDISAASLQQLLRDLDAIAWPGQPDMARVVYERLPVGSGVAGGMGGGLVATDGWIHPEFVRLGLESDIRRVIHGQQGRITRQQAREVRKPRWLGHLGIKTTVAFVACVALGLALLFLGLYTSQPLLRGIGTLLILWGGILMLGLVIRWLVYRGLG
jgi:hypothetical protein